MVVRPRGRIERTAIKRRDIFPLLPWLIEYTKARRPRSRGAAQEITPDDKYKRASQACRHSGRVKDAARALLAEQPSPGNDATWERLRAKFPDEDPAAVEQAIADAITVSLIEEEEGSAPRWRPKDEFDLPVLLAVIKSRSSYFGAGNDGRPAFFPPQVHRQHQNRERGVQRGVVVPLEKARR